MKKINWDNCECRGVIGGYPPENGRMLLPDNNVEQGMNVSAIYNGVTVMLEIKAEIGNQIFSATVSSIEGHEQPTDLHSGDIVEIERQYICWLFV